MEAHSAGALFRASAAAAGRSSWACRALWVVTRVRRRVGRRLLVIAEETVARSRLADVEVVRASHPQSVERGVVTALSVALSS